MLTLQAKAYNVVTSLLVPGAKADTAAATSTWVDISAYDGPIFVIAAVGTVTAGQIAGKIQTATDASGTGAADVVSFTTVTTSNDPKVEVQVIDSANLKSHIAYIGTVTTGPVDAAVSILACSQYA